MVSVRLGCFDQQPTFVLDVCLLAFDNACPDPVWKPVRMDRRRLGSARRARCRGPPGGPPPPRPYPPEPPLEPAAVFRAAGVCDEEAPPSAPPLRRPLPCGSGGRDCPPAPDLVLRRLVFPKGVLLRRGVLFAEAGRKLVRGPPPPAAAPRPCQPDYRTSPAGNRGPQKGIQYSRSRKSHD